MRDEQGQVPELLQAALEQGILAGVPLEQFSDQWRDCFLVAVTEKRTKSDIDQWAQALSGAATPSETLHA